MKKRENENISIGTLFGIFEDIVDLLCLFRKILIIYLNMEYLKQV